MWTFFLKCRSISKRTNINAGNCFYVNSDLEFKAANHMTSLIESNLLLFEHYLNKLSFKYYATFY